MPIVTVADLCIFVVHGLFIKFIKFIKGYLKVIIVKREQQGRTRNRPLH